MRLVHERDARRLADYYAENRHFLKPREPIRDESHCYPSGWQARLGMISEFHKQGTAYYFALLDPDEKRLSALRTSQTWCGDPSMPVISATHCAEMAGQG